MSDSRLSRRHGTGRLRLCGGVVVSVLIAITPGLSASLSHSQTVAVEPSHFEVASVKRHRANDDLMFALQFHEGGRFTSTGSLRMLIRTAYSVQERQLEGGPAWADRDLYDITAQADGKATPDAMRQMLRTLLAERFSLRLRSEHREMPVYGLVVVKQGRLNATTVDCDAVAARARRDTPPPAPSPGERPPCGVWFAPGRLVAGGLTMTALATNLSQWTDRVVIDRTELRGSYDVELRWAPDHLPSVPTPLSTSDSFSVASTALNAPALPIALEEQLGLRLEAQRGLGEVLVIEEIDRPMPD